MDKIAHCVMNIMLMAGTVLAGALSVANAAEQPMLTIFAYHDIRDQVADSGDADPYAVSTERLVAHFDWLRESEFNVISLDQVIAASEGREELPENPVLLTFDDGLKSTYTKLFPLLKAYNYPAIVAVVTSWIENPQIQVQYGSEQLTAEEFVTWEQIREMSDSGLVEIASHSHNLHHGVLGNPQGNTMAAAVTRKYNEQDGQYESDESYQQRILDDLTRSVELIEAHTGTAPRAMVWPYGAYNQVGDEMSVRAGMPITFGLQNPPQPLQVGMPLLGLDRYLIFDNPTLADLVDTIRIPPTPPVRRMVQLDLDYVYDEDPEQQQRNLDALVSRMHDLKPDYVFLIQMVMTPLTPCIFPIGIYPCVPIFLAAWHGNSIHVQVFRFLPGCLCWPGNYRIWINVRR